MDSSKKAGVALMEKAIGILVFLSTFAFYLIQAAPSVTAGDSGEFITSAATLSIAHAPSFPLFMLSGKIFSDIVPWGNVAYRLNIFSAFTSALSLLFLYLIGREFRVSRVGGLSVLLLLATSASFWNNSLVTEVFSLNTFLAVFLLWVCAKIFFSENEEKGNSLFCLASFVLGVGLGNHHILVFYGLGAFLFIYFKRNLFKWTLVLSSIFFFFMGLSVYAALPIRSAKEPPLNWGKPTSIPRLVRTITRKDYGSFRLALEESPSRSLKNSIRHLNNFGKHMAREVSIPVLIFSAAGLIWGLKRRLPFAIFSFCLFLLSGPLFYLLGNLPFNGQSDGIMGRFFILPVLFLIANLFVFGSRLLVLGPLLLIVSFVRASPIEFDHRFSTLVMDYGRSILRTMPPGSILFMDGGDDAFYSLAMLHYVEGRRSDLALHDRGGLVFKNPYGDDFRSLSRDEKRDRRLSIESRYVGHRPLFYSTMDDQALPGTALIQRGFLYEADGNDVIRLEWPLLCLRALYPPLPQDYRTRALAAFFPYMRGKKLLDQNDYGAALDYFRRAQVIGYDVDWLKTNLGDVYGRWGFESLTKGRSALAEWIYTSWVRFDPLNMAAQSNLGVALERQGKIEEARAQYQKAAALFPEGHDPVYNLAVISWKEEKWADVVKYLEEVLRRYPTHSQARGYLEQAKQRLRGIQP